MCLDSPQHHFVLMCEVTQTKKKKVVVDKCMKRQMLKVHIWSLCASPGDQVHRQPSFHKVVVNKGVHSMHIAWNMHFLPHTWVRQRIQSNQQPPEWWEQTLLLLCEPSPQIWGLDFAAHRVVQSRCQQGSALSLSAQCRGCRTSPASWSSGGNQERDSREHSSKRSLSVFLWPPRVWC